MYDVIHFHPHELVSIFSSNFDEIHASRVYPRIKEFNLYQDEREKVTSFRLTRSKSCLIAKQHTALNTNFAPMELRKLEFDIIIDLVYLSVM